MKRLVVLLTLCLLLAGVFCLPVSAETAATQVDLQCTVTAEGDCLVTATVNLRLEAAIDRLTYPVPLDATNITVHGSKAAACGADQLGEAMTVFRFGFPAMTVTLDGQPAADYGNQGGPLSYSTIYGGDNGEVILDAGASGPNLLILGESYDNAVLKLLASHYDTLYSVDLRYYAHTMGEPFDLSAYVQEHQITKVLLMGNIDFYIQDAFNLEG